jgi:hypothetical protein
MNVLAARLVAVMKAAAVAEEHSYVQKDSDFGCGTP